MQIKRYIKYTLMIVALFAALSCSTKSYARPTMADVLKKLYNEENADKDKVKALERDYINKWKLYNGGLNTTKRLVLGNGEFIYPLAGPTTLTSVLNPSRVVNGNNWTHGGTDFAYGGEGMEILASADGVVVDVGFCPLGGNYVMIRHEKSGQPEIIHTKYLHMQTLPFVSLNQEVYKGEVIGLVGNTGSWSTGAHLHFEVIVNGKRMDALGLLDVNYNGEEADYGWYSPPFTTSDVWNLPQDLEEFLRRRSAGDL